MSRGKAAPAKPHPASHVQLHRCKGIRDVRAAMEKILDCFSDRLPRKKDASVFIKPNLNSMMNALTGNTTDLRVLVSLVEALRRRGYSNITVGDGTSSGFYRFRINVIERLRVREAMRRMGVEVLDLNRAAGTGVALANGVRAELARPCLEAECLINLPKLKMHFETEMSVCLKNLMGCLVGVYNKQMAHRALSRNIVRLNQALRPHLHIVDALIAMEGTGPSRGLPVRMDTLIAGDDAIVTDLVCARLADVPYRDVGPLREAEEMRLLGPAELARAEAVPFEEWTRKLKRPEVSSLVRVVNDPRWQSKIVRVRLAPGIRKVFDANLIGRLLVASGLRQDVFIRDECICEKLSLDEARCTNCGKCDLYCPIGLDVRKALKENNAACFRCLYCYLVCPEDAIIFHGKPGFLAEQLRQYGKRTREIA